MGEGDAADDSGGFGEQLRRGRAAAGLTQEELAAKSGLSVRAISDAERGRTAAPRRSTQRRLAEALSAPFTGVEAAAAGARWLPPAQLPADLADFTGRRAQVEQLTGLLAPAGDDAALPAVVVSAVAGAGGIGKSVLAVHAAHGVAARFPDGQIYLNLRGSGVQPVPPGEALARFLRDLGTDPAAVPAEAGERAARYRSLLAGRRLLILLDDARDAAQVRPLLPGARGCAVLVTSRGSLPDLESARLLDLDVLTDADALAMFTRIVGQARAAAEPDAARQVLAACGGLPLAIRIAAARLSARPGWSIASLAARLADARHRLDELQAGDLAVRASFMVSYAHLGPGEARAAPAPDMAFRMLGLAEGPDVSLAAAGALLGVPPDQAERALERLVDAHLLQSAAPGRYRFHDLLRVYAAERARAEQQPEERDAAVRRLLSWYLHTAATAIGLISPLGSRGHPSPGPAEPGIAALTFTSYDEALAWLDAEHASLVAAVTQAASQGEHEIAWKLPVTLWDLFNLRGLLADWIATHQTGLTSARLLGNRRAEQGILNSLGGAYMLAGNSEAATECLRDAVVIARGLGERRSEITGQLNLGLALLESARLGEATQVLQEALSSSRQLGNRRSEGGALLVLGMVCRRRGQLTEAITAYQQALGALRETSDDSGVSNLAVEGDTLVEMSTARIMLGQLDLAVSDATAVLEIARRIGHRLLEAQALNLLGRARRDLGSPEQARTHWLDALAIFTDLGHPLASEVAADLSAPACGLNGS